ncbi:hypothetical protein GCM10010211_63450 [Streptomyces albospinus]|uniref:Integral membrane protein n=1 Tax=Streptomyces albospinus TaxID=285515 RepID=A0ABQ2VIN7_9ACTN|nr:hypothetical protein [Streptomyces albospinus]GGU88350.1 hypothetical protein GCM10010211_63450 [Streptomyces albospinus]
MVRNVLGCLIALIGATAAVWSPFRPWYDGRHGSDVRIEDLFNGITDNSATLFGSLVLPMVFAGLLTLVGVVLRSRLVITVAGLVVLGFTILWMVRQGQTAGELTAGTHGMGVGAANALGGGALLILGALVMRGRPRRVLERYDDREPYPPPESWDPEPYIGDTHSIYRADDDTPPAPWSAPPPPTRQHPQPPTRPNHRQPPTRPVEWGKEQRYPGAHGQPGPPGPGPQQPPDNGA